MRYVVIMAGGAGTRLWPLSVKGEPKQLLPIIDGKSLLRIAYERIAGVVPDENILICTGADYIDKVAEQIPQIPEKNLLGEPVGRDSLNAVAWPAAVLAEKDPQAVIATITADQLITPVSEFQRSLETAFELAESDPLALVTFGVVPDKPHTGYGYLRRGKQVADFSNAYQIEEFVEKPGMETAKQYFASGDYWWNSGMFVWQAETFLSQLQLLKPVTYQQVKTLAASPEQLSTIYPKLEKISVDYAVMEPVSRQEATAHVLGVGLQIDWEDVGSFATLATQLEKDKDGNATQGTTVVLDAANNLLINTRPNTVLAVSGISEMAVVTTPTATLVIPLADSQSVKEIVSVVKDEIDPSLA